MRINKFNLSYNIIIIYDQPSTRAAARINYSGGGCDVAYGVDMTKHVYTRRVCAGEPRHKRSPSLALERVFVACFASCSKLASCATADLT